MKRKTAVFLLVLSLVLVTSAGALGLTYAFSQVDAPNSNLTMAFGINMWGTIVGRYVDASGGQHGFMFSRGQFTTLAVPGAGSTNARGINDRGDIVGHSFLPGSPISHAFLYRNGTFSTIDFPQESDRHTASGINNAGDIVGTFRDASGKYHGFLFRQGKYIQFDYPGAEGMGGHVFSPSSSGPAINDVGDIAGTYFGTDGIEHAFLLRNGQFTNIDFPGSSSSAAHGINAWGVIAGSYTDSSEVVHGFISRNGVYTTVDFPFASSGIGGINALSATIWTAVDIGTAIRGYLSSEWLLRR